MIANILANTVGVLIFLFIFWKKLREDYASEIIFSSAFIILMGILISSLISFKFFPEWFFWSEFVGILLGFLVVIFKFKVRGYEVFDAIVISALPWLSFIFLKDSVVNSQLNSFVAFVLVLLFISIYYFLDLNYRGFTWYRSGRIGFSGLSTLGLFFLARTAIATFFPTVLSFVVKYEPYLSGLSAFTLFLLIYNLSKKEE